MKCEEAMPMAQMIQTSSETPDDRLSLELRNDRLQKLVGELLRTNEELRLNVAQLEAKAERAERGLADASAVYGLLMP
jgi:hypothetical protein